MSYKNAFRCKKCPQTNNENGCPCWLEITWTNDDGDTKIDKGCYFQLSPKLMLESVKAANISSEHACQMRNGFQHVAELARKKLVISDAQDDSNQKEIEYNGEKE